MINSPAFTVFAQDGLKAVEDLLRVQAEGYYPDLITVLDMLLAAGGKRLRPSMTILTGNMLGAPHVQLITMAAAIELLHTATLVHDDLIDGSLLRRGMPTLNSKWSSGATVLTGDFLFACAARLAADTDSVPAIKLFSQTLTEIVNGEILQLLGNRCQTDREEYHRRIYAKTASLFRTCARSAALISPTDPITVENVSGFGYEIGMAFQIMDDILDFTADQEKLGKPVGSDLRAGLITLPAIIYIENHPEDHDCRTILETNCLEDQNLIERLIAAIRSSDAIRLSHAEATAYVERGLELLRRLPESPERLALEEMADYMVLRQV